MSETTQLADVGKAKNYSKMETAGAFSAFKSGIYRGLLFGFSVLVVLIVKTTIFNLVYGYDDTFVVLRDSCELILGEHMKLYGSCDTEPFCDDYRRRIDEKINPSIAEQSSATAE